MPQEVSLDEALFEGFHSPFCYSKREIWSGVLEVKMTIKKLSIEYDALNSKNVFTNGDTINGRIIVLASKDSPIRSLVLVAAGAATVQWTEGEDEHIRHKVEYYGIKHYILKESEDGMYETIHPEPSRCNS